VAWSRYAFSLIPPSPLTSSLECLDWSFFPIANASKAKAGRGWRFNAETQSPHASETIALATFFPQGSSSGPFAYTLSRDRTLRAFNLTDLCPVGKVIDVHQGIEHLVRDVSDRSVSTNAEGTGTMYDEPIPQVPLLQILPASDEDWHFVFVLSPTPKGLDGGAVLRTYTAQIKKNDIANMSGVGYISCSEETLEAEFRGFTVEAAPGLASLKKSSTSSLNAGASLEDAVWRVWTAWDLGGRTLVEWSSLTNMLRPGSPVEDAPNSSTALTLLPGRAVTNPWKKVHDLSSMLEPEAVFDSTYIDELIDANDFDPEAPSDDIKRLMLSFIFYPGRFSQHTLASTLAEYHSNLPEHKQDAQYLRDPDIAVDVKVAEIIGCALQLEEDDESGLPRLAEFREDLKREYLGFWAGLQAQERQSRWPLLLTPSSANSLSSGTIVIGREGVIVPVVDNELSLMARLLENAEADETQQIAAEKADLLIVGPEPLEPFLPEIAESTRRADVAMALSAASVVAKSMTVYERDVQQTKVLDDLTQHLAEYSVVDAIDTILVNSGFNNESMLQLRTDVTDAFEEGYSPIKAVESCLDILSQPLPAHPKKRLTFYGTASAVSAASLDLGLRSKVLFELVLVTLVLRQAAIDAEELEDSATIQEQWFGIISRITAVLHRTLVAHWLSKWRSDGSRGLRGPNAATEESGVFGALFISAEDRTLVLDSQTYYSMFHALLTGQDVGVDMRDGSSDIGLDSLCKAVLRTTPIAKFSDSIKASAKEVILASRLFKMGLTEYAKALTTFWPLQTGMTYVRASALVLSGESEEAAQLYLSLSNVISTCLPFLLSMGNQSRLTVAFPHAGDNNWSAMEQSGLADALPASVRLGGLSAFYKHVMDVFEAYGFVQQSTRFAELAIRSSPPTDLTVEALHKKVFRAYLAMGTYEEAYAAMIANPFADL
jgi:nuclear pore complex protein Nup160